MEQGEILLQQHIDRLAPAIRKAILDTDMRGPMSTITDKYSLLINQASTLENSVWLLMLGIMTGEEFSRNISSELEIDKMTAENITKDVDQMILEQIRSNLKEGDEKEAPNEELDQSKLISEIEVPSKVGSRIKTMEPQLINQNPTKHHENYEQPKDATQLKTPEISKPSEVLNAPIETTEKTEDLAMERLGKTSSSLWEKESKDISGGDKLPTEEQRPKYDGGDPYREPVE